MKESRKDLSSSSSRSKWVCLYFSFPNAFFKRLRKTFHFHFSFWAFGFAYRNDFYLPLICQIYILSKLPISLLSCHVLSLSLSFHFVGLVVIILFSLIQGSGGGLSPGKLRSMLLLGVEKKRKQGKSLREEELHPTFSLRSQVSEIDDSGTILFNDLISWSISYTQ